MDMRNVKAMRTKIPPINANTSMALTNNNFNVSHLRQTLDAQGQKKLINTEYLTSVPRRGKMIDTRQYIRDNLQAYADNKYFAFTKNPGQSVDFSA